MYDTPCPHYYSPVTGVDGMFYPSECWAEQIGVAVQSYGVSDSVTQFIRDLWQTKKWFGSVSVPSPHLVFNYRLAQVLFRSTLWTDERNYYEMDFVIYDDDVHSENMTTYTSERETLKPVSGATLNALMVFISFDEVCQENTLYEWTEMYSTYLNDYLRRRQELSQPVQYAFTPVVIPPPVGVVDIANGYYTSDQKMNIYNDAIEQIGNHEPFDMMIVSPVISPGSGGGYFSSFDTGSNYMQFIYAPLNLQAPYSETNLYNGIKAINSFQYMFGVLYHEILHALGYHADHLPNYDTNWACGSSFYVNEGQFLNVDPTTGEMYGEHNWCDCVGESDDYYYIELPMGLKIYDNQEPTWLTHYPSYSGDCLRDGGRHALILKDHDLDGEYEMIYHNQITGDDKQQAFGWVDIDEDGIAELEDPTAYGGYIIDGNIDNYNVDYPLSTFEPIEEAIINGCIFERVRLENGVVGLVPLQCEDFNNDIVNIYRGVKYNWQEIESGYGTVLLPRLW
jgi:hypothetical protein